MKGYPKHNTHGASTNPLVLAWGYAETEFCLQAWT